MLWAAATFHVCTNLQTYVYSVNQYVICIKVALNLHIVCDESVHTLYSGLLTNAMHACIICRETFDFNIRKIFIF